MKYILFEQTMKNTILIIVPRKNDLKIPFYKKIDAYCGINISTLLRYASLYEFIMIDMKTETRTRKLESKRIRLICK